MQSLILWPRPNLQRTPRTLKSADSFFLLAALSETPKRCLNCGTTSSTEPSNSRLGILKLRSSRLSKGCVS